MTEETSENAAPFPEGFDEDDFEMQEFDPHIETVEGIHYLVFTMGSAQAWFTPENWVKFMNSCNKVIVHEMPDERQTTAGTRAVN